MVGLGIKKGQDVTPAPMQRDITSVAVLPSVSRSTVAHDRVVGQRCVNTLPLATVP